MNTNETRYANAIITFVEKELKLYETADVYRHLTQDFMLSDEEIADLGYDWLVPKSDEPLEDYEFDYTETYFKRFTVRARDSEEAYDIFRTEIVPNIKTTDLHLEDKCYFLH